MFQDLKAQAEEVINLPRKVLAIVAHPDDMEFFAGGTVRKMAQEGTEVREIIVTNGERGSYELTSEELIERRREEARKAAAVLGVRSVTFLGYPDGMLSDQRFNEIRERMMAQMRKYRPDAVITWDPFASFETHPDHRITGMAATEAASFAGLPLYHPEQVAGRVGLPNITQSYYIAKQHVDANEVVDITGQIKDKIKALCCHRTQMEFLVAGALLALKAQRVRPSLYNKIDPKRYRSVVDAAVRRMNSQIGKRIGVKYAEEFRVARADETARLLGIGHR